ncbi:alpha/beta hydrolase [Microbacterium sp. LRZ72]|uniref:alpha/beta fold hydrolase n=1 Tax=Microbacterium sp. LRZ72 TaxID=2942481 RepID=UPI0029B91356|nr:alpha/beta hydrolase [Microbacterium sp. LRZ72]MDX2376404.1 alpha/beta hydrolase [Microbacterium sp. LRZ72]
MPTLEVADAAIDYDVTGERGPLVVQLHGLTSSRARDAQLGLDLGRALRDHRVLRYDARGHGGSTGPRHPPAYRWERLADDLLALLDHVAPGERVHGVGPSMGTGTLLHAAVRDPARFASLTLVVPPTAWQTRRSQAETYLNGADVVEREGIGAFVELGSTAPVPPALAHAPATRPTVADHLLPMVLRGAAATDFPEREAITAIDAPTLILAWTGDRTHPISTAKHLHELMAGSRLEIARTPYGVMAWPGLFAEHVTMSS